ncbi:hypothetical protein [uncultured Gammaproteobacteria bacterium]|nr:hypothetical protein [uncultured Gammaproteobacteria bacterium]CAC9630649.1 hypothetical protein [uncultured Gammaproteobacteria bacterium]CAC9642095.1 hypothetical protein [uncultured Gammaproteobacteria bacterium]CAC9652693.1 hypothetical protein [uncultured Gammaproteobacteria bacterium]
MLGFYKIAKWVKSRFLVIIPIYAKASDKHYEFLVLFL